MDKAIEGGGTSAGPEIVAYAKANPETKIVIYTDEDMKYSGGKELFDGSIPNVKLIRVDLGESLKEATMKENLNESIKHVNADKIDIEQIKKDHPEVKFISDLLITDEFINSLSKNDIVVIETTGDNLSLKQTLKLRDVGCPIFILYKQGNMGGKATGVALGATLGGLTGAAAGSVVPGIGTVIGAILGAVGGTYLGVLSGDLFDKELDRTEKRNNEKREKERKHELELAKIQAHSKEPGAAVQENLKEHIQDRPAAVEDETKLQGGDTAVVDCQTDHKIIAHSEDEKPLDCLMKKPALEEPLAGEEVDIKLNEAENKLPEATDAEVEKMLDSKEFKKPISEAEVNSILSNSEKPAAGEKFDNALKDAKDAIVTPVKDGAKKLASDVKGAFTGKSEEKPVKEGLADHTAKIGETVFYGDSENQKEFKNEDVEESINEGIFDAKGGASNTV